MVLIMVVSIIFVLLMSFWGVSTEKSIGMMLSFTSVPLLCTIASLLFLLEKKKKKRKKEVLYILNNTPILYAREEIVLDGNGVITDLIFRSVNEYFTETLMPREACIGKSGYEVFPDSMSLFLEKSNLAKRTKKPVDFQYYFPGNDVFYAIKVVPVADGQYMDFFCLDRTRLYKARKEFKTFSEKMALALEVSQVYAWVWNIDGHKGDCQVITRDKAGKIVYNNVPVEENAVFSHIESEDRARVRKEADDLIAGKIPVMKVEYRMTPIATGHNELEWVESTAIVGERDADGRPLTLVGSLQIITHRKKIENELMVAKAREEEANKLKSAFLANMSHEIRTPLNAIVGFSDLIVNEQDENKRNKYAQIINSNNKLLLRLIEDILDLAKVEAGTMEFTISEFDLNKLMDDLNSMLQLRLETKKQVRLSYKCGLERCVIRSDYNRLTQIISNLVTNAIKFTDRGAINIGYELRNDMLWFYVSDTGCGISKDKQNSIFDRFVKLNDFKQGFGLGLSICKSIVDSLGGEIGIESEAGKGSTFWFTIPYTPVSQTEKDAADTRDAGGHSSDKINILVAEDNESNYELVSAILADDYNLLHAWNGRQAVEMFKKYNPQIILMDINMPEMDGYEATKVIRKLSTTVPILALTAYAYASDEKLILASGMNSYMSKPINAQQLCVRINSLLDECAAK